MLWMFLSQIFLIKYISTNIKIKYSKHPKTYYEINDELISKIKNSESFFFRKFDKNIDLNKYLNNIL